MSFVDAVKAIGPPPPKDAAQSLKKRYSEVLSRHLAVELAAGLRKIGFPKVKPERDGPHEREFQGGLGPKKVDVTYSDEQHGLIFAVSIKSITSSPFGKNLKNRFSDLCTEAITLHMRFPYSVVCALFAFPAAADQDHSKERGRRQTSTFRRATQLFATISGRSDYTNPGEKFENVTMLLFSPFVKTGRKQPSVKLIDTQTQKQLTERQYFSRLLELYNKRNPHALIEAAEEDGDEQ
ncbi:MAG: hypothetical protein WBF35_07600 [Candidatus Acidiferrales bacterium]